MKKGKNSFRKMIAALMLLALLAGSFAGIPAEAETQYHDIVLVLDQSGSMHGEAIRGLKEAAAQFCTMVLDNSTENRIALVLFDSQTYVTEFTNDLSELTDTIDEMYAGGSTNLCEAIREAEALLAGSGRDNAHMSIIVMADGYPESGEEAADGHYNYETMGPSYQYANVVYEYAVGLHPTRQIYTVGFLHNLSGSNKAHCELLLNDIQNAGYFAAADVDELMDVFGQLAQVIVNPLGITLSNQPGVDNDRPADSSGAVSDNEYVITASIHNENDIAVENVRAELKTPEGMVLADGEEASKPVGAIGSRADGTATWRVRVPRKDHQDDRSLQYEVQVSSDNTVELSQVETIFVKGYQAADNRIGYNGDTWSFTNSTDAFKHKQYYISDEIWNALCLGLSNSDKQALTELKNWDWGGSCYGMSSILVLNKLAMFQPEQWDSDADTLNQMQISDQSDTESVINYYQLMQFFGTTQAAYEQTQTMTVQQQISSLIEQANKVKNGGNPVLVCIKYLKKHFFKANETPGHALVAYDVETLSTPYVYKKTEYTTKIFLYDPNFLTAEDENCMYVTADGTQWCLPRYGCVSSPDMELEKKGDALISLITSDLGEIDLKNATDAVTNYKAVVRASNLTSFIVRTRNTKEELHVDGSRVGTINGRNVYYLGVGETTEGQIANSLLCVNLGEDGEQCTLETDEDDQEIDVAISYEDRYYSAKTDSGKTVEFERSDGVAMSDLNGGFAMEMTYDEPSEEIPWITVSVDGTDTEAAGVHHDDEGIMVDGDSLVNVSVKVVNGDVNKQCDLHTDARQVLLKTSDTQELIPYLDLDGDGVFSDLYERLTAIRFGDDSYTIQVNEQKHIPVTLEPEQPSEVVIWTSDDVSVAEVDENGTVTGMKEGTATIKASNYQGDVWQQCTVTVKDDTKKAGGNSMGAVAGIIAVLAILILVGVVIAVAATGTGKNTTGQYEKKQYEEQENWARDNIYQMLESTSAEQLPQEKPARFCGRITGVSGPYAGARIDLTPGEEIVIGKDARVSQLIIDQSYTKISRKHCGIRYNENEDMYEVVDYSMNGTYLENGAALAKNIYTKVKPGTCIYLDRRTITFRLEKRI